MKISRPWSCKAESGKKRRDSETLQLQAQIMSSSDNSDATLNAIECRIFFHARVINNCIFLLIIQFSE